MINIILNKGVKGDRGFQGWSPLCTPVEHNQQVVLQLYDFFGGEGEKPEITDEGNALYLGEEGLVSDINLATDIRGFQGQKGWSAVFSGILSGVKVVRQLLDWIGGEGPKPPILGPGNVPYYESPTGLTTNINNATDYRGPQGYQGWAAVHGSVPNGQNIVLQLLDWTGGEGTKPAVTSGGNPLYVCSTGYTTNINAATNFNPTKKSIAAGSVSTAYTADMSQADDLVISMTLNSDVTLTILNPSLGRTLTIYALQGGAGNFRFNYPAMVKFPGGATVDMNTAVGGLTVITMEANSTTSLVGYYAKH
ncbi:hypothetical protein [Arsenicibacter rosenii]|uniref:Tail fiber protein n=1 Tax=Arsenicibacter rosenii TaxID=1750698 RepID=A0A1S2VQY6_9BACT|nr:hypothetical protein [Arsenicibacter rosenii]OIN61189.1 hypothetical protein BLX24_03775 [Arsenicibacter rosenii]